MSVKAASSAALRQEIGSAQQYLCQQLNNYHTLLTETQNQIQNTLAMHLNAVFKQQHKDSNIIAALNEEIARLKDENSFLRNQCMIHSIKEEELQKSRIRILQQNAEKEERVRVLAKEVENIKNSVGSFAGNRENGSIVDFDEEEDCTKDKFEGLEVIREVSEHDLSITMSMQSLHSELIEESSNHRDFQADNEVSPSKTNAGSQESLGAQNCQIDNYQDALKFLKNYNNQGMQMTKKPIESQKKGNETINKIKRMRKIDDKDNQENICLGNEGYVAIAQSKLEYIEEADEKTKSSASIASSKFKSRVKENLVSLEEPMRAVMELLKHISAASLHALKKERIQDKFIKITFVGGLQYYGNCNEAQKPSGFGKLLMNKELVYHGEWRSGKFHGWGKLVLLAFAKEREKSIIQVDGHFKCGIMEGSVVCTFSSGQKFMGQVVGEQIEKEGTFVSEEGIMTGLWERNRLVCLI